MVKAPPKVSKYRFTVEVEGRARELFSVQERGSGDLGLYVKASRELSDPKSGALDAIKEHRFSVHVSPQSAGHVIKQTLRTNAGTQTTSALVLPIQGKAQRPSGLIVRPEREFRWPVFATQTPDLRAEQYDCQPKAKDEVISLGVCDPSRMDLVYLVVVTSKNVSTIATTRGRTSIRSIHLTKFNLHVVYGFTLVPSFPEAEFVTFVTSPVLKEGETVTGPREPAVARTEPMIEGEFFRSVLHFNQKFGRKWRERIAAEAEPLGDGEDPDLAVAYMQILAGTCVATAPMDAETRRASLDAYLAEVDAEGRRTSFDEEARQAMLAYLFRGGSAG